MPKLHELLAVDGQLKGQAEAARKDLRNTFEKKEHLFREKRVTFRPNGENQPPQVEAQSSIQSTIADELDWIGKLWGKAIDAAYNVDELNANPAARADVVLDDGSVLLAQVPTTALLQLEKRVNEIQELITAIPTLDPAKGFAPDPARPTGIYKAIEVSKKRTKKTFVPLVLAQATKEHPAQVKEGYEDLPIGDVLEQEWSSLITPKTKGDMLARVEEVARSVKAARMRANGVEVDKAALRSPATTIFGYVFDGTMPKSATK
jgi:hypothetical protein